MVALGLIVVQLWGVFGVRGTPLLLRVPGVLAIVWGFSYSSFVSTSTFGALSWTFIALAGVAGHRSLPVDASPVRRPARAAPPAARRPVSVRSVLGKA